MEPEIGDMVHFRSVCAACNKVGGRHFTFTIGDPDLLAILPEFSKKMHTYNEDGQKIDMWWDHSPSISEVIKAKFIALSMVLKLIVGYRERHGHEDTYLILLRDDQVFFIGPSRNILPLTHDEVSNAKISEIIGKMNITHFNYVDLSSSPPTDRFIRRKQAAILETVVNSIVEKRKLGGLSQLIESSALGKAALWSSESLITDENPQNERVYSEYRQKAEAAGYQGIGVAVAHYRKVWPLDTSNNVIAQDILDTFMPKAVEDSWEDWGFGISRGFDDNNPEQFCMCVVVGVGYSDGNALVTNYVNEERVKAGIQPLVLDYHLRHLARDYVAMNNEPDRSRLSIDIEQSSYVEGMSRFRSSYGRTFIPFPVDQDEISNYQLARLVADEVLKTAEESLLRSDWHDVGFAVKLEPVRTSTDSADLSIVTDCILAWRLPENTERPAHFPPPINEP